VICLAELPKDKFQAEAFTTPEPPFTIFRLPSVDRRGRAPLASALPARMCSAAG
jgi:hypothetical protein